MYVNHPSLSRELLLGYLRAYPQLLRLLIHTPLNAGYRCGHLHALAITKHVWSRFDWVVSLSGADIMLLPKAMLKLSKRLLQGTSTVLADCSAG